jgi:hypothetical protein
MNRQFREDLQKVFIQNVLYMMLMESLIEVISVSYDSRYKSYYMVRVYRPAMRTMVVYWRISESSESLRDGGTIRVSYCIE